MDKKNGTGRRSLHSVQLSLFKRNFAGMDGVAIVCFRGFFRFLYKIACLLVAAAILFCILSCLVF